MEAAGGGLPDTLCKIWKLQKCHMTEDRSDFDNVTWAMVDRHE